MNTTTPPSLRAIFDESRNGGEPFTRHPLVRHFIYSQGVKEVAEHAGAYWFLDIVGTEFVKFASPYRGTFTLGIVTLVVNEDETARIELSLSDDDPEPAYTRNIDYTDFPAGEWQFWMSPVYGDSGEFFGFNLFLPSEY